MLYYQIYVKKRKGTYTYSSNKELKIGSFVKVDFANKELIGLVIRLSNKEDIGDFKIKEIKEVLSDIPIIPDDILQLTHFINNYYITDFFASLQIIGPYENMSLENMSKIQVENTLVNDTDVLNEEQERVYKEIVNSDDKFYLIYGVTGSGKTQIYIKLIEEALKKDKGSIFLVPEISLTTQMKNRIKKVFGENVSLIHSKTTAKKKKEEWERIYSGKVKVVLGARSAIFAPIKNLGYILIDEEHENTYKQQENARYHTRNVAFKRAMLSNSKVVLGSATPSFETFHNCLDNKIRLLELKNRYNNAKLPDVEVIDLEQEEDILSKQLLNEIKNTLEKDEQVILFLNRKSYSLLLKCHNCNEKHKCKNCSSNMRYFKSENVLRCIHCKYETKLIKKCSNCGSEKIEFLGQGIEKIEEKLIEYFGEENILRVDGTNVKKLSDLENKLKDFKNQKYKIMIGTQIIAKGLDFPNVTLVGIINAEQSLQIPDFRQGERTFQLIMQAAGRAGRANKEGKVLIQSYDVNSELISCLIENDYERYFEYEMNIRRLLNLPPYKKMVKVIISSKNEEKSEQKAKIIKKILEKSFRNVSDINKANVFKLSNEYRFNIFIKTNNAEIKLNKNILFEVKGLSTSSIKVLVDVDPITT